MFDAEAFVDALLPESRARERPTTESKDAG